MKKPAKEKNKLLYEPFKYINKRRNNNLDVSDVNLKTEEKETEENNFIPPKETPKFSGIKSEALKKETKKKILSFILKNPYILAIIGLVIGFFALIILIVAVAGGDEFFAYDFDSYNNSKSYWWPVGSLETTVESGVIFARGEPSLTHITSGVIKDRVIKGKRSDHIAIDIAGSHGGVLKGEHNIIASRAGEVLLAKYNKSYGNYIIINHKNNEFTLYAHLDSMSVSVGDEVLQGQVIGKMGNTGNVYPEPSDANPSAGTHLHFEVRVGLNSINSRVDPMLYVDPLNPRKILVPEFNYLASVSVVETYLSKTEFRSSLERYGQSLGGEAQKNFNEYFVKEADLIYEVSTQNGINPEIVVSRAGIEAKNWGKCGEWYNFWGIGVSNEKGCDDGPHLTNMEEGVGAYCNLIKNYNTKGSSNYNKIVDRYNERNEAGCLPFGHGTPETFVGVMSIYAHFGDYLANPGSSGLGGCYYIKAWLTNSLLKDYYDEGYYNKRCPDSYFCDKPSTGGGDCVKSTICEQNDFTAYASAETLKVRKAIFGYY